MNQKIAIIGKGNVGKALENGFVSAGFQVRIAKKGQVVSATEWADVIFLAVPFIAIEETVREIGATADGKVVVDVTNALTPEMQLALGYSTSGAEELQKLLPHAKVVKSLNTVFAQHMALGSLHEQPLTVFAAGDDAEARQLVLQLTKALGFDAVDGGPLQNSRHLEALGYFNILLGYVLGNGPNIGLKLVR